MITEMIILQQILQKYCVGEKTGLLLLSMPTGFGKTHNVLDFIYQNYQIFKQQKRKIIFITNLKKNLPYQDLKQRFIKDNREQDYQENVLFINSNLEIVIEKFLDLESEIPAEFQESKNYQRLKKHLKTLAEAKNINPDYQQYLKDEIRTKHEPAFKEELKQKLNQKSKKKQERLDLIKHDPNYQWIGKLYPTVFTDEKTILFLSIDKFFLKNSTLIEPSYYCSEKLAENSVIFIDEFDATKDNILNQIIEAGKKHKIDLIKLFLNIHNHLKNTEFPQSLLKESEARKQYSQNNPNWKSLTEIIEEFKQDSQKIFTDFFLEYTYKNHPDNLTKSRNFLFYDYESHHVLDRRYNIIFETKKEDQTNWIRTIFYNDEKYQKYPKIISLISQIGGFLTYFQRGVSFLAENYQNLKKEQGNETFSLEAAISSVLDYGFKLDENTIEMLISNIRENYSPFVTKKTKNITQLQSFYEMGFKYHDIVDRDEHDLSSKIYFYNFNRTPEAFLAEICQKAMVIGISATASMNTNIGNYDLEYLKQSLKDSFYSLSQDELNQLKNEYENITKGYDKITITTKIIGTESKNEALEILTKMVDDEECANGLLTKCEENYIFYRYVRLLETWQYFSQNKDCQAFICFLNKFPKYGDSELDLAILEKYFCYVNNLEATKNNVKSIKENFIILRSENFEENLKALKEKLGKGERLFIISTYQTLGAGVNLQYPIPEGFKPIKINDFDNRLEMDINGVYLEKPTNLIVSLNEKKEIQDEDFIKHLFQLEFLFANNIMSREQFKNQLDKAFHKYIGNSYYYMKKEHKINLYENSAFTKYLNKVIIQALGRICRTNMKAPTIHILADNNIKKYLNRVQLPEDIIPVKEYQALIKNCADSMSLSNEIKEAKIKAENASHKTSKYIQTRLNNIWNAKNIEEWQSLRKQVLVQPTITNKKDCDNKWFPIYIELPKPNNYYRFTQENDYGDVEIFFNENEGEQKVSEKSCRLPQLMKINELQELFINNKWATTFEEAELILSPPIFNNIYKGALGEVCGKHILETKLNLQLLELDDYEFERFDFKTAEGIYFDFKFWSNTFDKDEETELEKIRAKMKEINAEKVFIINILAEARPFKPIVSDNKKIIRITFLCENNQISEKAIKYLFDQLNQ